ncbi:hypothetical protein HOLleu_12513 [Holothuria leucospilota]|uniref:Secreted protein n=1 Tax=Holothuria leucospilota TaxID=206669 RepID=A0A9Q1HD42_HOLLE|nr:hypothetical protein HOLleu_12513 [Holothuria leucospilota]
MKVKMMPLPGLALSVCTTIFLILPIIPTCEGQRTERSSPRISCGLHLLPSLFSKSCKNRAAGRRPITNPMKRKGGGADHQRKTEALWMQALLKEISGIFYPRT